jgi:hypothetical protein
VALLSALCSQARNTGGLLDSYFSSYLIQSIGIDMCLISKIMSSLSWTTSTSYFICASPTNSPQSIRRSFLNMWNWVRLGHVFASGEWVCFQNLELTKST